MAAAPSDQAAQQQAGAAPDQQATVNLSQGTPVFYGQPGSDVGYIPYGGYGPYGYPPIYQNGNLRYLDPWAPYVVGGIGGNVPTVMMRQFPSAPPRAGQVGPDMQRFLEGQYAIHAQIVFVPVY